MDKPRQTLKSLRAIALEHARAEQPDLASMARDLGQIVHRSPFSTATRWTRRCPRGQGLGRWLLARRDQPAVSVMLMAWPANHCTPLHDHAGLWGLELALIGALEVQSWSRDPNSGTLRALGTDWLGPGDGTWFEGDRNQLHRCRNLSQREIALTLHVYGGELTWYLAWQQAEPARISNGRAQQIALAGRMDT
ncbi:MAG: cysteine dioxygenase family protein [Rhodanobacter sp.]